MPELAIRAQNVNLIFTTFALNRLSNLPFFKTLILLILTDHLKFSLNQIYIYYRFVSNWLFKRFTGTFLNVLRILGVPCCPGYRRKVSNKENINIQDVANNVNIAVKVSPEYKNS